MKCSNCTKLRNKIRQLESVIAILKEDLENAKSLQKQLDDANKEVARVKEGLEALLGIGELPHQECSSCRWAKYRGYLTGDHCKNCNDMDGWEYNV